MKSHILKIKNMVCPRCIMVLSEELLKLGIKVIDIQLGSVTINNADYERISEIEKRIYHFGFAIIRDPDESMVESIKLKIQKYLTLMEEIGTISALSDYLSKEIGRNYSHISKLFSQKESLTIENYYINCRIQRVKELLDQNNMNLSEIAMRLRYSSVHYLSMQFKKVVGKTVSEYKSSSKNNCEIEAKDNHREMVPFIDCHLIKDGVGYKMYSTYLN